MPSAGEHNAPLRLITGADRQLIAAWRILAVLAVVAILLDNNPLLWRVGLLAVLIGALAMVEWRQRRSRSRHLVLFRDRRCELDGQPALLEPAAWLISRYAVLRLDTGDRLHRCLISATRQDPGEYRKLLAWMRLQPWNSA
jgi:hypothetical protein